VLRRLASAKINLALHVTGQRADGYHLLDSLVCFADFGDVVSVAPASELSLQVTGQMATDVPLGAGNLILQAAALFASAKGAAITLEKNLPVASGIGGGSADAAAVLHLLSALWQMPMPDEKALLTLGADVPVCVTGVAARMRGIGEDIIPIALPQFHAVLVNPGIEVSTPKVFSALKTKDNQPLAEIPTDGDASQWLTFLCQQRNDLQTPASGFVPAIGEALSLLHQSKGCELARMSGSGATCFGVFTSDKLAAQAAEEISATHPDWWVEQTLLGS
jgi:4-diphosphocytidyl-2-C-methyl-D-erythritol kinase